MPLANSCLEGSSSSAAASHDTVRLAVLTMASRDLLEPCLVWMHYYTQVEHIPPRDIYVIEAAANRELRRCFHRLPRRNLVEMPAPTFRSIPPGALSSFRTVQQRLNSTTCLFCSGDRASASTADTAYSRYSERHRLVAYASIQRELFALGYTHTLIVDQDELVMADPRQFGGLLDYLRANPHRRTVAPANAYDVQVAEPDEAALDWAARPLLRGQRSLMLPSCGFRKAILSRVPTTFTLSTHNMKNPLYFAWWLAALRTSDPLTCRLADAVLASCAVSAPGKWGSADDCLDGSLWLLHIKCADLELPTRRAGMLVDKDRGSGNTSLVGAHLRRRCGHISAWRQRSCRPGPKLGAGDSPDGPACQAPFRYAHTGPQIHMVRVERIPSWVLDRV